MLVQSCHAVLIYRSPTKKQLRYALSDNQAVIIGCDSACQIALDPTLYRGVFRRHAELCSVVAAGKSTQWQIHDLNSTNGVFINGHPLQRSQVLRNGDRITLGKPGIEFLFELQFAHAALSKFTRSDSALLSEPVYEHDSESNIGSMSATVTPKSGFSVAKIMAGVVGVSAILFLNSALTPQQSQSPAIPTRSEPSSAFSSQQHPGTGLSDVEFQGIDLFTQYFDIIEGKVAEDVPHTTTSGQAATFDAYRFNVVAKSAFQDSDVNFTIDFYDAAGNVVSPSTQIYYASLPPNWTPGMRRAAVFLLPSDRSNLKVIRFSH